MAPLPLFSKLATLVLDRFSIARALRHGSSFWVGVEVCEACVTALAKAFTDVCTRDLLAPGVEIRVLTV